MVTSHTKKHLPIATKVTTYPYLINFLINVTKINFLIIASRNIMLEQHNLLYELESKKLGETLFSRKIIIQENWKNIIFLKNYNPKKLAQYTLPELSLVIYLIKLSLVNISSNTTLLTIN